MEASRILAAIDREIYQLQQARAVLIGDAAPKKTAGRPKKGAVAVPVERRTSKKKRNLTAEGRKRISEAVKKRWALQKKATAK